MKSLNILLVEDNKGDVLLATETLDDSRIVYDITSVCDGKAAIDFFENLKTLDEAPDVVLLDINLPKKSGHEVLQFIKKSPWRQYTRVVMLTTSSAERDVLSAYKYYADGYLVKPLAIDELLAALIKTGCPVPLK
ncbi:MAG: response regulator [Mucilaginibacter sp.]